MSTDDLNNSIPTKIINISTINADIYSILPCPQGWSLSTFFCDILKPIIVITDEPASVILFKPSEIIDIEFEITPITTFTIDNIKFTIIPVILDKVPYFVLTFVSFTFLSFMNKLINKFVIFYSFPYFLYIYLQIFAKYYTTISILKQYFIFHFILIFGN